MLILLSQDVWCNIENVLKISNISELFSGASRQVKWQTCKISARIAY